MVNSGETTLPHPSKKPKHGHTSDDDDIPQKIMTTRTEALQLWLQQLQNSTDRIYQDLYGEHWEVGKVIEGEKVAKLQVAEKGRREVLERMERERGERGRIDLRGSGVFLDDRDMRY